MSNRFWELDAAGDYDGALRMLGSEHRAEWLALYALDSTPAEAQKLLRDHWTGTDGTRNHWKDLLDAFAHAGFVTDTRKRFAPDEEVTIYRGDLGDGDGISWTTSRRRASWFAGYCRSPRAALVGIIPPEHGIPTVWRATVHGRDILGYFAERKEREVVVHPYVTERTREIVEQGEHLARAGTRT